MGHDLHRLTPTHRVRSNRPPKNAFSLRGQDSASFARIDGRVTYIRYLLLRRRQPKPACHTKNNFRIIDGTARSSHRKRRLDIDHSPSNLDPPLQVINPSSNRHNFVIFAAYHPTLQQMCLNFIDRNSNHDAI